MTTRFLVIDRKQTYYFLRRNPADDGHDVPAKAVDFSEDRNPAWTIGEDRPMPTLCQHRTQPNVYRVLPASPRDNDPEWHRLNRHHDNAENWDEALAKGASLR